MIDEPLRAFLERGTALVVGTVRPDGAPSAQRGWACAVVGPTTLRILLDSSDRTLQDAASAGGPIAITGADVNTLQSVQLKGRVVGVEQPTSADLERCQAHNTELFDDIARTDFHPVELTSRLEPPGYLVAVVEVDEVYDQTPGPGAGAPVVPAR